MEMIIDIFLGLYADLAVWSNENQGVITAVIFLLTVAYGFSSGIFSSLRSKPKFKIQILPGPSFFSMHCKNRKAGVHNAHRTSFALYLNVSNTGSAASSINSVSIGYHWHVMPLSKAWFRYRIGWFWLQERTVALQDFQVLIGDNVKVFPFMFQRNQLTSEHTDTYLEIGKSVIGVVYFEQSDSWGGCYPKCSNGYSKIKVAVCDVFGKRHIQKFWIPLVSLEEGRKFNPSFGLTLDTLHGEVSCANESNTEPQIIPTPAASQRARSRLHRRGMTPRLQRGVRRRDSA